MIKTHTRLIILLYNLFLKIMIDSNLIFSIFEIYFCLLSTYKNK